MNDMQVPEEIDMMTPSMNPITGKIQDNKGDHVCPDRCFKMNQGNSTHQPSIRQYGNTQSQHILRNVGNAAAQAADHIHVTYCVFAFIPAPEFFEKDER